MRNVSSLSRAGEAISLLQLCGYREVTDWGPSMSIAKLQAQSQTHTGYSLRQERRPTCQRLSCRAWEMPFLADSLESCLHKAVEPGGSLLLWPNALIPAPLHVSSCTSRRHPDIPRKHYHLSPPLPSGPSSFPRAAPSSPPSPPDAEVSEASRGRSCQRHKWSCCYATPVVQQLVLGKTCNALKLFA